MELEQLKKSWDKLSERLEREEVIRKRELQILAESKIKSYWSKVRMNQYLGWLVLICAIGILFVQGIQNADAGGIAKDPEQIGQIKQPVIVGHQTVQVT